jgi:hypothetical protein
VALGITLTLAAAALAVSPVGTDGTIHGCYVAKGKTRGTLRVLPARKQCKKRRHEKPITWSVQGPQGTPGSTGAAGAQGPQGAQGESGISPAQVSALVERINQQDATIASLTATVNGLTTTVGGLLAKLNGISGAELNSTVDGLAALTALCTRAGDQTTFGNDLRSAVSGIALSGLIPAGLTLTIPGLPTALNAFSCPAF